ncbi:MAG: AraC family transcriptional regulator [Oscillospiraceae bacterium]
MGQVIRTIEYKTVPIGASRHQHNLYQMIYIKSGRLEVTIDGSSYKIEKPSIIFISNLEQHEFHVISKDYTRYLMLIDQNSVASALGNALLLSVFVARSERFSHVVCVKEIDDRIGVLFKMLYDESRLQNISFPETDVLILKNILILLYRICPNNFTDSPSGTANAVWEIKQSIDDDLLSDFSLEFLSKKYYLSTYYLAHSFKKIIGYSIKQYQILCRISASKELLCTSNLTVSGISEQVGFSDLSNFSRSFGKIVGCSPTAYKKSMKNGGS